MNFLLDENFPRAAYRLLEELGHGVIDLRDTNNCGRDDAWVFKLAQEHSAVLLSTDRDFFHTIPHTYQHHCGVIVIALKQPNRINILSRLRWFIERMEDTELCDKVYELRDNGFVLIQPNGGS